MKPSGACYIAVSLVGPSGGNGGIVGLFTIRLLPGRGGGREGGCSSVLMRDVGFQVRAVCRGGV
jgi:hypothetical protein